jgi:hypothetical protein
LFRIRSARYPVYIQSLQQLNWQPVRLEYSRG